MRKLIALFVFSLLLTAGLSSPASAGETPARPAPLDLGRLFATPTAASTSCTLYCYHNVLSNLSCTSQVGDCQYQIGDARDFLVCDGKVTACPLIHF